MNATKRPSPEVDVWELCESAWPPDESTLTRVVVCADAAPAAQASAAQMAAVRKVGKSIACSLSMSDDEFEARRERDPVQCSGVEFERLEVDRQSAQGPVARDRLGDRR